MQWEKAPDIKKMLTSIVPKLPMEHVDLTKIVCFRSFGAKTRARARIWSFPRIWQDALNLPAHYIIEVMSEKFDRLSQDDKERVLIHELLHIPKNFSGSLRPHKAHKWRLDHRIVETLFKQYKSNM